MAIQSHPLGIGAIALSFSLASIAALNPQSLIGQEARESLDTVSLENSVVNYRTALGEIQSDDNQSFIELNLDLARALRSLGRHSESSEAIEQALQSIRIENGLYDESQLTILETAIDSAIDGQDWNLVHRNFYVALSILERNVAPNDPRFEKWVRWFTSWAINAYRFELVSDEDNNALLDAISFYESLTAAMDSEDPDFTEKLLTFTGEKNLARYFNALDIYSTPYEEFDSQAPETITGQSCHVVMRNGQPTTVCRNTQVPNPDFFENRQQVKAAALQREVRKIIESYEELISSLERTPETTPLVLARAFLYWGDMHFLLQDVQSAKEKYARTHEILSDSELDDSVENTLMGQPANILKGFSHEGAQQFSSHFGTPTGLVSFDVSDGGLVSNLGITGQGPDLEIANQELIAERIRNSVYRPKLVSGEPVDSRVLQQPAEEL